MWTALGLVLALIGVGAAMINVPGPGHWEFRISRLCFIGAAVLFLGKVAVWGMEDISLQRMGIVAIAGAAIVVGLALSPHWVKTKQDAVIGRPERVDTVSTNTQSEIDIRFNSNAPYEVSEISHGHVLSTVRIGLKASGQSFSNCKIYIEKIAPAPPIVGGLPIILHGSDFVLRHDDPEKFVDIASRWDHADKFRFNSPSGFWAESLNYIDDSIERAISIKITCIKTDGSELQKPHYLTFQPMHQRNFI